MSVGNSRICIYRQFGLGAQSQQSPDGNDGTHVEDLKNPAEVQLPGGDLLLVVFCMEMPRNHIPFALLGDLPLDLHQSPEVWSETPSASYFESGRCWCNSRRQLLDRLTHEVVKVVQPLPIKSPVQGGTDFGAGQTKLDVVHLVDHCVLGASLSAIGQQETKRRLTLIITRITLTKPKTTSAGVILETSFARFMASMVPSNAEIVSSRLLGRWGSTFIVGVAAREL